MALPINIGDLLHGKTVEWERIELKAGWNPEKVVRTICAFANDINNWGGGYIIIGVEEDQGKAVLPPVGIATESIDSIQKKLVNLSNRIEPKYFPVPQPEIVDEKHILVIWVPGGDNRPYKAPTTLGNKAQMVHYVRRGSETVKAKSEDERRLYEQAAKIPFDDRINHQASIDDLSFSAIQGFLKDVNSKLFEEAPKLPFQELCRRMNIVKGPDENIRPINAGLLMFNESPEKFYRGAKIEVVIFEDEVGDRLLENTFTGPLHVQLKGALSYLQNNVLKEKVTKVKRKAEALRFYNYPYEALEEALSNAVYHRGYEHAAPIEVRIKEGTIEILSFPGPLPPLDKKRLQKGEIAARDYRNRRIGDFLKELHLTEGRGTGIPKIKRAMQRNGSPSPQFDTDDDNTYFLVKLPIHPSFLEIELIIDQLRILEFCREPRDRSAIFKHIKLSNQYKNHQKYLVPLLEYEYLTQSTPTGSSSRGYVYALTEKGERKLDVEPSWKHKKK